MHHLLEHINQDKKGDKAKIRTQQCIKMNTGAKEIKQVNPVGLTTAKASGSTVSSIDKS